MYFSFDSRSKNNRSIQKFMDAINKLKAHFNSYKSRGRHSQRNEIEIYLEKTLYII